MTILLWLIPVPIPFRVTQTFSQHPGYGKGTDFGGDNMPIYASRGVRISQVTNEFPIKCEFVKCASFIHKRILSIFIKN